MIKIIRYKFNNLKNMNILNKRIYHSDYIINKLPELYNEIYEFSLKNQSSVTINQLLKLSEMNYNDRINISAKYLYKEIPIRLARRIKDLEKLPFGLSQTNGVCNVRKWYIQSFLDFRLYDEKEINNTTKFLNMIEKVYNRHNPTIITMAKGIHEISKMNKYNIENINDLLNRFFTSRIGIRVLLGHFIELHKKTTNNYFGIICTNTNPKKILLDAIEDASYVALKNNNEIPKINIICEEDIHICYIPNHLYYVLFEILKNSIGAVNRTPNENKKIECLIRHDKNVVKIKISDNGIGIKKDNMKNIWKYSYTTTKINLDEHFESDFSKEAPLSGIGYGLAMSKLYLEYFGGRIEIFSEYGKGTDVYIYLHKSGNFDEPLV